MQVSTELNRQLAGTLSCWLQMYGMAEDQARTLFQQLLVALDYCHRLGVANRDIKVGLLPILLLPLAVSLLPCSSAFFLLLLAPTYVRPWRLRCGLCCCGAVSA